MLNKAVRVGFTMICEGSQRTIGEEHVTIWQRSFQAEGTAIKALGGESDWQEAQKTEAPAREK